MKRIKLLVRGEVDPSKWAGGQVPLPDKFAGGLAAIRLTDSEGNELGRAIRQEDKHASNHISLVTVWFPHTASDYFLDNKKVKVRPLSAPKRPPDLVVQAVAEDYQVPDIDQDTQPESAPATLESVLAENDRLKALLKNIQDLAGSITNE